MTENSKKSGNRASVIPPALKSSAEVAQKAGWQIAKGVRQITGLMKNLSQGVTVEADDSELNTKRKPVKNSRRSRPPIATPDADTKHESVNINTELNMESDHNFYKGLSEDIEEGGIFVATFDPKPIGATVLVRFKMPGGNPVMARGVVQFVREDNVLLDDDQRSGMGVRFTDLMKSDRTAIEDYLKKRSPIFYDE